jgi:hypothetical protein
MEKITLVTIITGIFVMALVYLQGEEILLRNKPKKLMTVKVDQVPKNLTFNI